jgi:flavin reductase (DIM6/NTAB) family NADH-FMN oxidoreductase RutF
MKRSLGARTIAVPTPTWVVGTYDTSGRANAATVAWAGICCSRPPCVAVSLRRATHTHGSIVARRAFTVCIPSAERVREADYLGLISGRDVDKLAKLGLTVVRSELVDAPYVAEFPLVLECRLIQTVEIGSHTQFIGEILDVKADEGILDASGRIDPAKARPIVFAAGADAYYAVAERLGTAFSIGKAI